MIDPKNWTGPIRSQFDSDLEMREIIRMFVDEMPQRLDALRTAWDASRADELQRLAHQLKGAAAGYGFPIVGDAAAELESALRNTERELVEVRSEFETLVDLCARTAL